MGIAQQHALAAAGGIAAQGQAVAAAVNIAQLQGGVLQRAHGVVQRIGGGGGSFIRACGGKNRAPEQTLLRAATQRLAAQEQEQVHTVDGVYPVGVATAVIAFGQVIETGFFQIAIHAPAVALGEITGKLWQGRDKLLGKSVLVTVEKAKQEIRFDIAHLLPHELCRTTGGKDNFTHRHAVVILRVGIAEAVAQAAPILGTDVWDAILRAADFSRIGELRLRWRRRGCNQVAGVGAGGQHHAQGRRENST